MPLGLSYRYDAPDTEEPHHHIARTIGGEAGRVLGYAPITDACDFGGTATGNVLNAAGGSGAAALGSYISCDGKSIAIFKVEYGAATGTRRFRVIGRDTDATAAYFPFSGVFEPGNLGLNGSSSPALATLCSSYYHGEAITMDCSGLKEVALLLELGETGDPTVHVWGCAI